MLDIPDVLLRSMLLLAEKGTIAFVNFLHPALLKQLLGGVGMSRKKLGPVVAENGQ
jgi:hypothetical protein